MSVENPLKLFPDNLFPILFHGFKYSPSARPIQPKSLVLYANIENGRVVGHWLCVCIEIHDDGTYILMSNNTTICATPDKCIALTHTIPISSTEVIRDVYTPIFTKRDRSKKFEQDLEIIVNPFIITYN